MESRTRRLASLARLLEQRKASLNAQQAALAAQAREIDDRRRTLLRTVDGAIAAHGLFVDLLAAGIKRLDVKALGVERQQAALTDAMRDNARRVRLEDDRGASAVRDEAREQAKQDLIDLIDAAPTTPAASFRKGS